MNELIFKETTELAQLIRNKQCSAVEVLSAHIAQIDKHNGDINAVVTLDIEKAKIQAQAADEALSRGELSGALHGIPMTIKDAYDTQGIPSSYGIPGNSNYTPKQDATVVTKLKQAGAIIFGKTNVPTNCYDWQCQHPDFGRTNNPWNFNCTPGGSSGGAAAALASGFTPLEVGSDVGGSIRVPAHFCGVFGIRPTEQSVSGIGHIRVEKYASCLRNLASYGPMARSIADLKLVLPSLRGIDLQNWQVPPVPWIAENQENKINEIKILKGLKVAFTFELGGVPVDSDTKKSLQNLVNNLESAGCHIEEIAPKEFDFNEALEVWGHIQGFEISPVLPGLIKNTPLRKILPYFYWRNYFDDSPLLSLL